MSINVIAAILAAVVLFFAGAVVGVEAAQSVAVNDCDLMGQFRINDQVYKCAKATKEQREGGE